MTRPPTTGARPAAATAEVVTLIVRARLAAPGRADALLDTVVEKLKAAGLVRAGGRARTDSTHVIAATPSPLDALGVKAKQKLRK